MRLDLMSTSMRLLRSTGRPLLGTAMVALTLASAALAAGCGGDDDGDGTATASAAGGFDSPYCVTARRWAAHELNGGGDGAYARGGPRALEKWWNEQLAYLRTSLRQAPPVIRRAEALNERAIRTRLTPMIRNYGFDFERVQAEASPSEKAFLQAPPPDIANAQEARNLYQNRVCGYGGEPPAADVTFTPSAAAKPYCEAVAADERAFEKVVSSGFDPDALRSYVNSDGFSRTLAAQDAEAPPTIAADVRADNKWTRTRALDVLEEFGYDVRRLLREGTAEDLRVFTRWDRAIRAQSSRVTAYQEQVCGVDA